MAALSWAYAHDMEDAGRIPAEFHAEKVLWKALSRPVGRIPAEFHAEKVLWKALSRPVGED